MPVLDSHSLDFFSRSTEQTRRLGTRLGAVLQRGDVIGLQGDAAALKGSPWGAGRL